MKMGVTWIVNATREPVADQRFERRELTLFEHPSLDSGCGEERVALRDVGELAFARAERERPAAVEVELEPFRGELLEERQAALPPREQDLAHPPGGWRGALAPELEQPARQCCVRSWAKPEGAVRVEQPAQRVGDGAGGRERCGRTQRHEPRVP